MKIILKEWVIRIMTFVSKMGKKPFPEALSSAVLKTFREPLRETTLKVSLCSVLV